MFTKRNRLSRRRAKIMVRRFLQGNGRWDIRDVLRILRGVDTSTLQLIMCRLAQLHSIQPEDIAVHIGRPRMAFLFESNSDRLAFSNRFDRDVHVS